MKKIFSLSIVVMFSVAIFAAMTADAIEVYTFKKDRVDQEIHGNQGYLTGNAPAQTGDRNLKRTLIGVDIELPVGGSSSKTTASKAKKSKPLPPKKKKGTEVEVKEKALVKPVPVVQEEAEDNWIK
ncbi:MAG: hypothetical protein P9L88_01745 [Candidatus Tantalella remota]|nr:hypothetical protein [Candidatus Tantalella remota]